MTNNILKFVGVVLFVIGLLLIPVNFDYPHSSLVQTSVQFPRLVEVPVESILGSDNPRVLESNQYWFYDNITINAGETIKMNWSADTPITGYIFSNSQYNNFTKNYLGHSVNSEATGSGKTDTLTYDVTNTGNHVALLKTGGSSVQLYQFMVSKITYSDQTQYTTRTIVDQKKDNLYLYIGIGILILGIGIFYKSSPRRATNKNETKS